MRQAKQKESHKMKIQITANTREGASSELYDLVEQRLESAFPGENLSDMSWGDIAGQLEDGEFKSSENDQELADFLKKAQSLWFEYND
jgi:hypothetical protein